MEEKEYHNCGYFQWKKKYMMTVTTLNRTQYDCGYCQWKKQNMRTVATPNERKRV